MTAHTVIDWKSLLLACTESDAVNSRSYYLSITSFCVAFSLILPIK